MNQQREGQGRPPWGVDLRIVDDAGQELPRDGETQGELQIRGHWIVDSDFGQDGSALTDDGGGEWISTVELENIAIAHPKIANAAAIAARHPKWDERPVILAVAAEGESPTEDEVKATYDGKVASWQVPDRLIFVDDLPLGATGATVRGAA